MSPNVYSAEEEKLPLKWLNYEMTFCGEDLENVSVLTFEGLG